jgi:uncharacterized membrane protein SirB2
MYLLLKHLHLTAVAVSIGLFALRGAWFVTGSPRFAARWTRIVPHVVDTVLLASALGLVWILHQYPFVHAWLTAKVLALTAYIALGSVAFRPGRPRAVRLAALGAALLVVAYIVSVALAHDPWGALAPLVR